MRIATWGALCAAMIAGSASMAGAKCADAGAVADARAAAEEACDCATATNHGEYVSCVADVAQDRVEAELLPANCKGEVTRCAARSTCGKPDFVTCCRVSAKGKVKCSTKSSAD